MDQDLRLSGRRVARELSAIIERRGKPGMVVSGHGTELTSNAILTWCAEEEIEWHYIAPSNSAALPANAHALRHEVARAEK